MPAGARLRMNKRSGWPQRLSLENVEELVAQLEFVHTEPAPTDIIVVRGAPVPTSSRPA